MSKPLPPPPPGAERRQHTRFELMAQIELSLGGEVTILPVINMSAGGVLVDASGAAVMVVVGEQVKVFLSPDERTAPFAIAGKIVRIDRHADGEIGGLAVMWTSADAIAQAGLTRLLDRLKR
jgi:pyridoxal biosynthesis lyase PdxS